MKTCFLVSARVLALAAGLALPGLRANPFVATPDIGADPNWSTYGTIIDGSYDAFDGYGMIVSQPAGLNTARRTELLAGTNTYRFFDTFTNATGNTVTGQLRIYGNLGSDAATQVAHNDGTLLVTNEHTPGLGAFDPVVAMVFGNNAWAAANTTVTIGGANNSPDSVWFEVNLAVAAGQSVSVVSYAALFRPDDSWAYYDPTASVAAAIAFGGQLRSAPDFSGLTQTEIDRILNFNPGQAVPPPPAPVATPDGAPTLGLVGAAAMTLALGRRRSPRARRGD